MNQKIAKFVERYGSLIAILAGAVFVIVGIVGIYQNQTFSKASGKIVSIEVEYGNETDESNRYTVMVEYTVDGTTYYSDIGTLKSGWYEGKIIPILYNPEKPEQITEQGLKGPVIAMVFGGVAVAAGVYSLVRKKASNNGEQGQ